MSTATMKDFRGYRATHAERALWAHVQRLRDPRTLELVRLREEEGATFVVIGERLGISRQRARFLYRRYRDDLAGARVLGLAQVQASDGGKSNGHKRSG